MLQTDKLVLQVRNMLGKRHDPPATRGRTSLDLIVEHLGHSVGDSNVESVAREIAEEHGIERAEAKAKTVPKAYERECLLLREIYSHRDQRRGDLRR